MFKIKLNNFYKEILREVIIAIIISSLVTYWFNLKLDSRAASRDFIYDFDRTYFDNPKYRNLSIAIEESSVYGRGQILQSNGGQFTDYDMDDYLSLLQDLYVYGEDGLVPYDLINNQFYYYVCVTYVNKEVEGYREKLKREGFSDAGAWGFLDVFAKRLNISKDSNCKVY